MENFEMELPLNMKKIIVISIFIFLVCIFFYRGYFAVNTSKKTIFLTEEVNRTCGEAEKHLAIFNQKFPSNQNNSTNPKSLESIEWKTLVAWDQACETAKSDLEHALNEK